MSSVVVQPGAEDLPCDHGSTLDQCQKLRVYTSKGVSWHQKHVMFFFLSYKKDTGAHQEYAAWIKLMAPK